MHHCPSPPPSCHAFSLVEISIILVIIGLLVGGVLTGTSLIKQSEMQTVVSDYSKYSAAVSQFNQQYGGLPGDILDATNFWGDDPTLVTGCADAAVTDGTPGTCNGDGDADMSDGNEPYRAWQQLQLANYVKGSFTGLPSGGGAVPETNVPKSRVTNAGWSFGYKADTTTAPVATQYNQDLSNFLAIGRPIVGGLTQAAALTTGEAWNIDTKVDNGLPGTGRVVALKTTSLADCATTDVDATATYKRTFTGVACSLNMSLTLK